MKNRYGSRFPKLKLAHNLQKSKTKLVKLRNQLKFLRRCRDNGFIPRGLRIKLSKDEIQVGNVSRMNYRLESVRVSSAIKKRKTTEDIFCEDIFLTGDICTELTEEKINGDRF
jgi:hypothetical protein